LRVYIYKRNLFWAINELIDSIEAGFRGRLFSYKVIIGALKRWGRW